MMKTTLYIVVPVCLIGCGPAAEETVRGFTVCIESILSSQQKRGDLPEGVKVSYDRNRFFGNESDSTVTSCDPLFGEASDSHPDRSLLSILRLTLEIRTEDAIRFSVIGIAPKQGPPSV